MKFSIVVAFRNRDEKRVRFFLDSLQWQSRKDFELIFVNQGSDEHVCEWVEELVGRYSFVHYIYNFSRGHLWNKSNALNIGIQAAIGSYIVIADIDIIFSPDFLENITPYLTPGIFTTHNAFYLPENYKLKEIGSLFQTDHYKICKDQFIGLCIASKEFFLNIDGYDEFYLVWGAEDDDIIKRLESAGLKRMHLSAQLMKIYHQWHPSGAPNKPDLWYLTMVTYLFRENKDKSEGCLRGIVLGQKDRPILRFINESDSCKSGTKLEFWEDQPLLFFNPFIKKFYQLSSGETAYLVYQLGSSELERKGNNFFSDLFTKKQIEKEKLREKDIIGFLEYFVGVNRPRLKDYYLRYSDNCVQFALIKR
jgi:glycosyltransferase involved in cell wall biosynthesis